MRTPGILALLIFVFAGSAFSQATYNVVLSGFEMVPQVRTPAMGSLEVWFDSDTLYVRGDFSDLRDTYWAASIHYGEKGKTGNRLFRLRSSLNEDKRSGELKEEENKFHLRPVQRTALRDGNLYISIATNRHQQGEIRGQIPRM